MGKKEKRRIILLASAGVFLVLLLVSVEITSHSRFCGTCHYMKSFYMSWETSSHSEIECSTCHYAPGLRSKFRAKVEGLMQVGRYWTKLYLKSKPWAEIPDEACLREGCHDKRLLEGRVKFNKIVFDHKVHFSDLKRGKQLRCTSCHSQIVQGDHITVTNSTCFICHFKESEHYPQISECSHCHHREDLVSEKISRYNHSLVFEKGFECDKCHSQTIMGDAAVPRENCYKCHWEIDRLEKYDDTDLMHSTHIASHKIECNLCHLDIQHKIIKDMETIAECRTCHIDYHQTQKILFAGVGGKRLAHPMPSVMREKGLSCKGCHIFHEESGGRLIRSETFTARAQACESCHGKGFARILQAWETATEKKLTRIKSILATASLEIRRSRKANAEKARMHLEEAAFNIDLVERGKSVHNMTYSQALLQAAHESMVEALRLIGSSFDPGEFRAAAEEVPTECSSCHAGIEEINARVFGLDFPHKKHVVDRQIPCDACHSSLRKHGELIATRQSCAACHHQEPEKDCSSCHRLQAAFYQGGTLNGQKIPADLMFEAGVDCLDCHQGPRNQLVRSDKNKCLDCHEADYGELFLEWQGSVRNLIQSAKAAIKEARQRELTGTEKDRLLELERALGRIELDGSLGVHNFFFIEEFLTNSIKILKSFNEKALDE